MDRVPMFKPYVSEQAVTNARDVLRSSWIGEGPQVAIFQEALERKFGFRYVVALNNGTAGLHLALVLAGIGPGDEVITTAMTCTATNHPILQAGATPVFADIQYQTGNLDPADVERHITEHTRAILCMHWGGYPCDLDQMATIARRHKLTLIQDGAQALGSTFQGKPLSEWDCYLVVSFQAIKIITCVDGGMLSCPDEISYQEAIRRRWYGIDRVQRTPTTEGYWDWAANEVGYKYHMNDVAAAIGLGNLAHFDELYNRRVEIVARYRQALVGVPGVTLFEAKSDRKSGHYLFTMHVEGRAEFCKMMEEQSVEVSIVHRRNDLDPIFGGRRDDMPMLDEYEKTYINIPLHNHLTDDDVERVIESVRRGW